MQAPHLALPFNMPLAAHERNTIRVRSCVISARRLAFGQARVRDEGAFSSVTAGYSAIYDSVLWGKCGAANVTWSVGISGSCFWSALDKASCHRVPASRWYSRVKLDPVSP